MTRVTAADRAEAIYSSSSFQILYSDREDESQAIGLFRKFADQRVSFTDCVSFTLWPWTLAGARIKITNNTRSEVRSMVASSSGIASSPVPKVNRPC